MEHVVLKDWNITNFSGITINKNLHWYKEIKTLFSKLSSGLLILNAIYLKIDTKQLTNCYYCFFHSKISYSILYYTIQYCFGG